MRAVGHVLIAGNLVWRGSPCTRVRSARLWIASQVCTSAHENQQGWQPSGVNPLTYDTYPTCFAASFTAAILP